MKTSFFIPLMLLAALTGCKKTEDVQDPASPDAQTVEVSLASARTYSYNFGSTSNTSAEIVAPAAHASLSRIAIVPTSSLTSGNSTSFTYVPDSTYTGKDSVIIQISDPSVHEQGCGNKNNANKQPAKIKFHFTIGQGN
jgi:hypothetical protein